MKGTLNHFLILILVVIVVIGGITAISIHADQPPNSTSFNRASQPVFITGGTLPVSTSPITVVQSSTPWNVSGSSVYITNSISVTITTVTVNQGTIPWDVSGSTIVVQGFQISGSTVTVLQGTTPWIIAPTTFSVQNVVGSTLAVNVVNQQSVSGSTVTVLQGTTPWVISPTTFSIQNVAGSTLTVNVVNQQSVSGSTVTVLQGSFPWMITGGTVGVSGSTVSISNFPSTQTVVFASTQPVTVVNFPAVQNVNASGSNIVVSSGSLAISTGSITAFQNSVWSVTGGTFSIVGTTLPIVFATTQPVTVTNFPLTQIVVGSVNVTGSTVTANQGASGTQEWLTRLSSTTSSVLAVQLGTWTVVASSFDIRALTFQRDKADVSGSTISVTQGSFPWVVTGGTFSIVGTTLPVISPDVYSARTSSAAISNAGSTVILSTNTSRQALECISKCSNTKEVYLHFGPGPALAKDQPLDACSSFEPPRGINFKGIVSAIGSTLASQDIRCTEW